MLQRELELRGFGKFGTDGIGPYMSVYTFRINTFIDITSFYLTIGKGVY